ncbi:glycosyltransferase [Mucilaginibacter lacusdianchii]|uniref:glycosyltransferase n=1 Tax=Mucilaginibacter lacusdianchii TaxID=2684211 RepID=UPI00131BC7A9|nr:glycosyltransferase [Mucilaginibacter sp. JXJ CY 39]
MISVIICSVDKCLLNNVSLNIANTIGVPFEIIGIDNSNISRGICEVYNLGARQARYEILCFVHEDVLFQTPNWGQVVTGIFQSRPDIGLLGVAGSKYKAMAPSGWHGSGMRFDYVNIIQGHKRSSLPPSPYLRNPEGESLVEAVTLDGVWLCTTKSVMLKAQFDDHTFRNFHAYDLDFCLAVLQHYKVAITFDVLLLHLSEGSCDKTWLLENLKFHKKWKKYLPAATVTLSSKQQYKIEKETFKDFINTLISLKLPAKIAYAELWRNYIYLYKWPALFFKLHHYVFKQYLKAN